MWPAPCKGGVGISIPYLVVTAYLSIPTSHPSFTLVLLSDILSILQVGPDTSKPGDVRASSMCAQVGQWGLYLGNIGENNSDLVKDLGPIGRYPVMSDSAWKTWMHLSPNLCLMEGMQEMYSSRQYRLPVQRVKCSHMIEGSEKVELPEPCSLSEVV
jgi:hypothetical protein